MGERAPVLNSRTHGGGGGWLLTAAVRIRVHKSTLTVMLAAQVADGP